MQIHSLNTDLDKNGVPRFSWKCTSDRRGNSQRRYNITVAADGGFENIVWTSGDVHSDNTLYVRYGGEQLRECCDYYWRVSVTDSEGVIFVSEASRFETYKKGTDKFSWNGAEWVGAPYKTVNPCGVREYVFTAQVCADKMAAALNARNKDNCVLFEFDFKGRCVTAYEICDNAWGGAYNGYTTNRPYKRVCGRENGYEIPQDAVRDINIVRISVENGGKSASVSINGTVITDGTLKMPENIPNQPHKDRLFGFGICRKMGRAEFFKIKVETGTGNILFDEDYSESGIISNLGTVKDGRLIVENEFNITSAVPCVNVRKSFEVKGRVKRARLYASARGFYEAFVNGERTDEDFYNPGFTDYRLRIMYQTYDITDKLKNGINTVGATVARGYYSGYVGYNDMPMIYGDENSFIAQLVIEYTDGTREIISTDKTWEFTGKGAVLEADYLQGETYDARMEFDWNDLNDARWIKCGVYGWTEYAEPTNGKLENIPFELCPQYGPTARAERVLKPCGKLTENPKGHFVYDMGQNMVGTVRLRIKGERGKSVRLRYGEMCCKNGELYVQNLRTAANTDVYTLKGSADGEVFIPSFTAHGFRYVEVSGCGCELTKGDIKNISVEGIVITNTTENTGSFECSNELINRLQSNIQWGQRGNSLLVYTDCPQRNERMGWTGDAQVFAATAAYNMNVRKFMNKWLCDLRDSQLLYNRDGAVPDTAPLGGDNRPYGGCGGWGDAAVIVPWEMYCAYGDTAVLEDNYDMMIKWVEYQNTEDRKNYGMRMVNDEEAPSDLSDIPYIQCQQPRGDHLTFDESTPFILSATAYAAYSAQIVSKAAHILGKTDDEKKYRDRFENIRRAFKSAWVKEDGSLAYWGEMSKSGRDIKDNIINRTYYSNESGNGAQPSQTAYALAVDFGLIDDEVLAKTGECLKKSIDERGGCLSVGFLGISHLAPALVRCGLVDEAFALLMQTRNPGWLYSVINGATTIWERWNSYTAETDTFGDVNMNSFNHYSYGAIGEWMYKTIAGINMLEPGYKKIELRPIIGGGLTYASAGYESVHGLIVSEWEMGDSKISYHCTVPVNTSAVLYLPTVNSGSVSERGGFEGVLKIGTQNSAAVYELTSGEYWFEGEFHTGMFCV